MSLLRRIQAGIRRSLWISQSSGPRGATFHMENLCKRIVPGLSLLRLSCHSLEGGKLPKDSEPDTVSINLKFSSFPLPPLLPDRPISLNRLINNLQSCGLPAQFIRSSLAIPLSRKKEECMSRSCEVKRLSRRLKNRMMRNSVPFQLFTSQCSLFIQSHGLGNSIRVRRSQSSNSADGQRLVSFSTSIS